MKRNAFVVLFLFVAWMNLSAQKNVPYVDAAPFDSIVDGKKVALYTITNGKVAAQVCNYGGFIVGLFSPDKEGKYANLVTHYESLRQYLKYNLGVVGPAVGRFANRIANGKFTLDGKDYQITLNSGPHTLHGGNQGFDHTVWDVKKAAKDKLVLTCVLADGLDGFPGTLTTTLTYSITKDDGLSIEFEATTDKPTVVNMTNHAYFNLNGAGSGDVLGHELMINADKVTEADRMNIPTGKFLSVEGTLNDFRKPVKLGDRQAVVRGWGAEIPEGKVRQYDTNFCVNHEGNGVEKVAELYSPESGRMMEVWNNHPGLQVYSGARMAIALESQMYPDSPNHPEFPSTRLDPQQKYQHTIIYKLKVK